MIKCQDNYTLKKCVNPDGFTLIELLVAMATFVIVIVAVVDVFLVGLGGTQRLFGGQNVQDSARYILESMAKEIRMSAINTASGGPYTTLNITNSKGQTLNYIFDNSAKQLSRAGEVLNSNEVEVSGNFYVQKGEQWQPRVTVVMKAKAGTAKAAQQAEINLQTTISSRQYAQ